MPIAPIEKPGYRESDGNDKVFAPASVELAETPDETSSIDKASGAKVTVNKDGEVTIEMNPDAGKKPKASKFDANLAEFMDDTDLASVSAEILLGIENDIQSRAQWESAYKKGITLMGLNLEDASSAVGSSGNISKVYHPLLIETTVRYQSNAMAELLPSSGPVKVRDDALQTDFARNALADAFEKDFNHYLTVVAKEYYPDTDQMLFNQGWSGIAFKKIFFCPLRKRPASDLVLAPDLIVSNDVVDLETANRVTHRTYLSNAMVRRLQRAKVYRKVELSQPVEQPTDIEQKVAEVSNIMISNKLPSDHRHTIYECYAELDLPGYEEDIPLPYCITVDKDSREILSIRRNWEEKDEDFKSDCKFVKYGMIPALGFYDLGFVHLLGNTTRALTAILRMQLDAGQFSIFPGFLYSKIGGKQAVSEIRLSPGSGQEIDTGGQPIGNAVMTLPYPGPSSVLATIAEKTAQDGMRLGGASEITVGEGRADVPVGTTMALIEQATKVMAAVHKRNHVAQQREFEKLRNLFLKHPDSLSKFSKNPAHQWSTAEEFADLELIPASDPNIPSHTHRLMQANALVMLAQGAPNEVNRRAVLQQAISTIGYKNPDQFLAPPKDPNAPPPPLPPELQLKQQDLQLKQQQMQLQAEQQALHDRAKLQETQIETINKEKDRQSREQIEKLKASADLHKHELDLKSDTLKHVSGLLSEHLKHDSKLAHDRQLHIGGIISDNNMHKEELSHKEKMESLKPDSPGSVDMADSFRHN